MKFVFIGCGRIAQKHAEIIVSGVIPKASLAAVCDLNKEKAKNFSLKYNVPFFTDMHLMMRSVEADIIVILSESGNHSKNVFDLIRYGKHFIVEKPITLTLDDAHLMAVNCKKANLALFVVKQNRFNLPVLKLKEAIDSGRFGKLIMGTVRVRWSRTQDYYDQDEWRGTWGMDGGVLSNQAIHHIDLLLQMMGDVESVFAYSTKAIAKIEAEDTAIACLKFKNGALGLIEATTTVRPKDLEGSISILGEYGNVEIAGFAVNEMKAWNFIDCNEKETEEILTNYSTNPPNVYGFGHKRFYELTTQSILNNSRPPVFVDEAIKSLELLTVIYESIEYKKEVFIDDDRRPIKLGHH
jgi:predicted dehydrogenase